MYNVPIYRELGGSRMIVGSGGTSVLIGSGVIQGVLSAPGTMIVGSGAALQVQPGGLMVGSQGSYNTDLSTTDFAALTGAMSVYDTDNLQVFFQILGVGINNVTNELKNYGILT